MSSTVILIVFYNIERDYIGTLINLDIPLPDHVRIYTDCNIPRGIFFPPGFPDDVVIAFLGKRGIKYEIIRINIQTLAIAYHRKYLNIRAYSIRDGTQSWFIPLRSHSLFVDRSS